MADPPTLSRRAFIAVGAAAAAASLQAGLAAPAASASRARLVPQNRIGIQLFTVRDLMAADAPGTLALLAEIGYREVEVAGLFGRTPAQFRALLDANHLRAVGNHHFVGPALVPLFGARTVDDILDEAEALGQRYTGTAAITIPPGIVEGVGEAQTASRYRELAELSNEWGAAARARGLRFYIHTHYWEFGTDPQTGEELFQILLDETDPKLVFFELDIFWAVFGGIDPLPWLTRYEDRIPLLHVKDGIPNPAGGFFDAGFTDLGEGVIDFRRLFTALRKRGAHHYIAERDTQPHPAETARKAYAYLRDLRAT
jgi:sugar phosphate isomerase/epimerase